MIRLFLNEQEDKLKELKVYYTRSEIAQQPEIWKKTYEIIKSQKENIRSYFEMITHKHSNVKVILTGAGTSAFVGDTIEPYLNKVCDQQIYNIQSIPTTNIVSNPENYLDQKIPTIMVSFARSGDSPESVAAVELGEGIINDFYQIHITCNKDGFLAKKACNQKKSLLLLMPEESNDKGFAMTSSFTSMMLGALLAFQIDKIDYFEKIISLISHMGNHILSCESQRLEEVSKLPVNNIIYLGSGPFLGLAHEASLKMLELTDGNIFTYYESPLGLRHGPKTLINDQTLAIIFISNNECTQKYDIDLLKELYNEKRRSNIKIMAVSHQFLDVIKENSDFYFFYPFDKEEYVGSEKTDDIWSAFPFILYAQILGVYNSLKLGKYPDNPVPNGSVNRVVKGVTIYPFQ